MNRIAAVAPLALLGACWSPSARMSSQTSVGATVVGLEPSSPVPLTATVTVLFSAPVKPKSAAWSLSVSGPDQSQVMSDAVLAGDGQSLALSPLPAWPAGAQLSVALADTFSDLSGHPLDPSSAVSFATATATRSGVFVLRAPTPSERAPINLAYLTIAVDPPDFPVDEVVLESSTQRIHANVLDRDATGLVIAQLPNFLGPCQPLCMSTEYGLVVRGAQAQQDVLKIVETSTETDGLIPAWTSTAVDFTGDSIVVRASTNKPVRVRGHLRSELGAEIPLARTWLPASFVFLEPEGQLEPEESYVVVLEGEDEVGHGLPTIQFQVVLPPQVSVEITELVADPLHVWSDDSGAGPFVSPDPGTPTVDDQWIELVNLSAHAIDLTTTTVVLQTIATTLHETPLDQAPLYRFGDGGSMTHWSPGEALVLHPHGAMAHTRLLAQVVAGQTILSTLKIGPDPDADHPGGHPPDFVHEAIAKDPSGRFLWCAPTPGDPRPATDCVDP
jgi:hypothetical protein